MDLSNDPRASAFSAAQFRDAIKFAMRMGMPNATEERLTFKWRRDETYQRQDPAGKPYNWKATPVTDNTPEPVLVDGAVEFSDRNSASSGTAMGRFDTPRATITLLDVDYALIEGADMVELGGATYQIDFVAPPMGLFDVTVYQIYASAVDEF